MLGPLAIAQGEAMYIGALRLDSGGLMHSPERPRYGLVRQCLWLSIDMLDEVMSRDSATEFERDRALHFRNHLLDLLHGLNKLEKNRSTPSPAA